MFEAVQPVSVFHLSQLRLIIAINKLWDVEVVQSHFAGVNQIVGKSMIVGRRIFNIVEGLSFGGDLCHGSGLWRLRGPSRR